MEGFWQPAYNIHCPKGQRNFWCKVIDSPELPGHCTEQSSLQWPGEADSERDAGADTWYWRHETVGPQGCGRSPKSVPHSRFCSILINKKLFQMS